MFLLLSFSFWSLVFMIKRMSEVLVVGLIAQVWFVLHCFEAICFKIQKEKKAKSLTLNQCLRINFKDLNSERSGLSVVRDVGCFNGLVALLIIHFYRSALVFRGPRGLCGKLRTEQLDLFTSFCCWRRKKHIWKVMWRQKKKRAWHTETKFSPFKPFFAVDILQVFNIDCIWSCFVFEEKKKKTTINLCIWRWQWWKEEILLYDLIS